MQKGLTEVIFLYHALGRKLMVRERTYGRREEWPKAGKAAEPGLCHRQALRHGALLAVPGFHSTTLALAGFHHCTRILCVLLIMGCDSYSLCYWRSGRDLLNSCKYY